MNASTERRLRIPDLPPAFAPFVAMLLLLVLAVGVFASHVRSAPLDDIEAQSALAVQAMRSPLGNGALTATASGRPAAPLPTALVAAASSLSGSADVSVLAIRLPSLIAGLLLMPLVAWLAAREYGQGAGLIAGLAVLGSLVFFRDVHQGSPLMLQAAMAAGYLQSLRLAMTTLRAPARIASVGLAWLAAALLVAAGGFAIALLVALAGVMHAVPAPRSARWMGLAASGVSLGVLIATVAMLGPAGSASLLGPVWVEPTRLWMGIGNPLLASALLWLAWLPAILAGAIFAVCRPSGAGRLALTVLVLALVMGALAPSYLESLWAVTLAPTAVLAALGVYWLCRNPSETQDRSRVGVARFGHALVAVWLCLCAIGAGVFLGHQPVVGGFLPSAYALVATALVIVALIRLLWPAGRAAAARWQPTALAGVAVVIMLMQAGAQNRAWSTTRFYQAELAQSLKAYPSLPIVALLPVRPAVFRYYLARPVALVANAHTLCSRLWSTPSVPRLLLLHPVDVPRVERAGPRLELLEQSPGSMQSSVIAARLICDAAADRGSASGGY